MDQTVDSSMHSEEDSGVLVSDLNVGISLASFRHTLQSVPSCKQSETLRG